MGASAKELAAAVAAFAGDKAALDAKAEAMEKLERDNAQTREKMGRERKVAEEERKQLARLLLGMGEKISTNTLPTSAVGAADGLGDEGPPQSILL